MRALFFILTILVAAPAFSQIGATLRRDKVVSGGGGPTYDTTPDSISNLIAWWETDSGVTQSSGVVTSWIDQMSSRDLVQSFSTYRPLFSSSVSALNNKPAIDFDGSNDRLEYLDTIDHGSDVTFIIALYPHTQSAEMRPWGIEFDTDPRFFIPVRLFSDGTSTTYANHTGVDQSAAPSGNWSVNTGYMFTGVISEGSSITNWRNTTEGANTTTSGTFSGSGNPGELFRVGCNRSASGNFFNGYIMCILIYNKALSDTEIQNLYDDYFKVKYGI